MEVLSIETEAPVEFSLWVRVPWWVKGEAVLAVNGQEVRRAPAGAGFVELRRLWSDGDTLRVTLPQGVATWSLPEDPHMAWRDTFKTVGQERGIRFIPMYQVGYESYTTYFPLKRQ